MLGRRCHAECVALAILALPCRVVVDGLITRAARYFNVQSVNKLLIKEAIYEMAGGVV